MTTETRPKTPEERAQTIGCRDLGSSDEILADAACVDCVTQAIAEAVAAERAPLTRERIETPATADARSNAQEWIKTAGDLVLTDDESVRQATDLTAWVAELLAKLEAARKVWTEPITADAKTVNDFFRELRTPLEEADRIVREKLLAWKRERERIAREAQIAEERRLQEERRRIEEAVANEELPAEAIDEVPVAAYTPPPPPTTVRSTLGSATFRKVWTFEVVDPKQVPDEFWLIDEGAIGRQVRAGRRAIPGVRIFQTDELASRRSR